jgi:hypothetical protein
MKAWLVAAAISVSGQAPMPNDAVQNASAAITIAQSICAGLYKAKTGLKWKANFYDGVWDVQVMLGVKFTTAPEPYGLMVKVRASDGTSEKCDQFEDMTEY